MAILSNSQFTRLEHGRITDCNYFLVTGLVTDKRSFVASITPVDSKGNFENPVGSFFIEMSIDNPSLLIEMHNQAIKYLQEINPDISFTIVDLDKV